MIKRTVRRLVRAAGFDIVRYEAPPETKRTGDLTFYQTSTGNYYLPAAAEADLIANAIRSNAIFDPKIHEIASRYIMPDTTVLDVGSNFGQMAILMSRLVGDGEVHAFEADDFVYSILQKNVQANPGNIVTHFGAVHNRSNDTLYFPVQDFKRFGSYGSYGIDYVHGKGRPVPTLAIDDITFRLPISFMKIDIQGGDLLAMQGAIRTIATHRMPIVFEYEFLFEAELELSFQAYVDFVRGIDYRFSSVIDGQSYLILPSERA